MILGTSLKLMWSVDNWDMAQEELLYLTLTLEKEVHRSGREVGSALALKAVCKTAPVLLSLIPHVAHLTKMLE